jgi:two-component system NarL family sensor kinase
LAQPVPGAFTVRPPLPGRASSAPARLEAGPPSVRRAVLRFMASSLAAIIVLAVATVYVQRRLGEEAAIRSARASGALIGHGIVQPVLTEAALAGPGPAQTLLDSVVRARVLGPDIVRVKIWRADGMVLYSDERRLMGATYALETDDTAVLTTGETDADISDLSKPENRFERGSGRLLEVYLPVTVAPTGRTVLFELYQRFDERSVSAATLWRRSAFALLAAIAVVWLLQIPFALKLARRLRTGHEERERLLQRAVDASNVERRRIASDLHDGVIPQLAGTAYALGAAGQRAAKAPMWETEGVLTQSAGTVRDSIQQLRSLIVDIHPPNLATVGLAGALEELAAGVPGSVLEVGVDVEPNLAIGLDRERLLFRGAQEALRNVVAHSRATRATLVVAAHDGGALLVASDDGIGFTPEDIEERRGEGHVGLGLLAELVADAGGSLEIDSRPGLGTTVRLWVPGP